MGRALSSLVYGVLFLFSLLPLRVHYVFSDIFHFFLFHVLKYRVSVVYTNIARSFPEMKYSEIKDLASRFYRSVTDIAVETVWAISKSEKTMRKHIELEGCDIVEEAYRRDKSVMVLTSHQGSLEIFFSLPDFRKYYGMDMPNESFRFVYKRPENGFSHHMINALRNRHRVGPAIETKSLARVIIGDKEGKSFYFSPCDQYPSAQDKVEVDFLNQKTGFLTGPGNMAGKRSLQILYCGLRRASRGHYVARFEMICEDASKMTREEITREYVRLLERDIMEQKESWLWSHKRWK